jgi:hypothetical protein
MHQKEKLSYSQCTTNIRNHLCFKLLFFYSFSLVLSFRYSQKQNKQITGIDTDIETSEVIVHFESVFFLVQKYIFLLFYVAVFFSLIGHSRAKIQGPEDGLSLCSKCR